MEQQQQQQQLNWNLDKCGKYAIGFKSRGYNNWDKIFVFFLIVCWFFRQFKHRKQQKRLKSTENHRYWASKI